MMNHHKNRMDDLGVKLHRFADLKEEWMSENLSRKLVIGRNEMLGYVFMKKGTVVPSHHHISEQISVILEGSIRFIIGEEEIVVREGEALVIPAHL